MKYKGSRYDSSLSTKDIAKKIREYVKKTYSYCKFSIKKDGYDSINVTILEAPFCLTKDGSNQNYWFESEEVFTEEANKMLKDVYEYVESYNYDNSDPYTDYFNTNFYFHRIEIGDWGNPFKVVEPKPKKEKVKRTESVNNTEVSDGLDIVDYSEKSIVVIGNTKPIKDLLKSMGGKFNVRLSCGAGWVFPKSLETMVRSVLNLS